MYHTLIVDDEKLMRSYLAENTASLCPFFQVTGIARDGREAMDLLIRQDFDLIVTDIRMPEIDGLSLAKYVSENHPSAHVIVISGYSDFQYAQKAVKYHVFDYLVKPLNDTDYSNVLMKIKDLLDDERKQQSILSMVSYEKKSVSALRSLLFADIINGESRGFYQICDLLESQNQSLITRKYATVVLVTIDELSILLYNEKISLTDCHLKLNSICQNYCSENGYISIYDDNGFMEILINSDDQNGIPALAEKTYQDISCRMKALHLPQILVSYGETVTDMAELSEAGKNAFDAMALRLVSSFMPIPALEMQHDKSFLLALSTVCNNIYLDYLAADSDRLQLDISDYCALPGSHITVKDEMMYSSYLLQYLFKRSNVRLYYRHTLYHQIISSLNSQIQNSIVSRTAMKDMLSSVLKLLISTSKAQPVSETAQAVENAKQFILSHYSEQISLSQIADFVGVNSCYLSDILHKSLGMTYSKYLMKIRMEQAARMLSDNPAAKVYQVAESCGFVSSKHFITAFRKYHGVSPSQYEERLG